MATITENYTPLKLFSDLVAEYNIELSEEEEKVLDYYLDDAIIEENEAQRDGPEKNFRLAWLGHNILNRREDLASINKSLIELSFHYLREVWNQDIPDELGLSISDSWIVKIGGDANLEEENWFRHHNHAQALLTGIVYLNDSSHGTIIKKQEYSYPFYPFVWHQLVDDPWRKHYYRSESVKGKVLIMPAKMHHELIQTSDENDFRSTLIFNIYPCGVVSHQGGSELNYEDLNNHHLSKDFL